MRCAMPSSIRSSPRSTIAATVCSRWAQSPCRARAYIWESSFTGCVNPQVSIPAESVVSSFAPRTWKPERRWRNACRSCAGSWKARCWWPFVKIELKILRKEMAQTGHAMGNPAVCTAQVHRWILRHGPYSEDLAARLEKLDLGTLAEYYGVPVDDAHHALSDAFLTARVWQKMLYTLQAKGVLTLKKLLQIGGK